MSFNVVSLTWQQTANSTAINSQRQNRNDNFLEKKLYFYIFLKREKNLQI